MDNSDKKDFLVLMTGISELYDKPMGKPQMQLYFATLEDYSIKQVQEAVNMHVRNPDTGTWMPKPADIIKQITGTKKENDIDLEFTANSQWQLSVLRAISQVGSYRTPKFKDPITTACIVAAGGWAHLCKLTSEQLVWAGKEFIKNYENYSSRPIEQLPHHISGREDIQKLKESGQSSLKTIITNIEALKINEKPNEVKPDAPDEEV